MTIEDDKPGTSTTVRNTPDPLCYDTADLETAIRLMTEDALAGRNREAIEAELASIRRRFGQASTVERTDTGQLPDSSVSRVAIDPQTTNIGTTKPKEDRDR